MRRPHALLALSGALATFALVVLAASAGVVACGGNDKPPLTPDNLEPMTDSPEGGATPAASGSATPSK
jgi:hypothetical protein